VMDKPDLETTLGRLLGPGRPEVFCEGCFLELDRYVEAELAGADPEAAVPGLSAHLVGCPACAEDHASLLAFVRSEERAPRPGQLVDG
jgi:hypothetical protein